MKGVLMILMIAATLNSLAQKDLFLKSFSYIKSNKEIKKTLVKEFKLKRKRVCDENLIYLDSIIVDNNSIKRRLDRIYNHSLVDSFSLINLEKKINSSIFNRNSRNEYNLFLRFFSPYKNYVIAEITNFRQFRLTYTIEVILFFDGDTNIYDYKFNGIHYGI